MASKDLVIIDHEPVQNDARHIEPAFEASPNVKLNARPNAGNGSGPAFGRRISSGMAIGSEADQVPIRKKSAISVGFLSENRSGAKRDKSSRYSSLQTTLGSNESKLSGISPRLPIGALAAVFAIAVVVPTAFIAITEYLPSQTVDRITTASIAPQNPITIDTVSMTRILKNGTAVATIHGTLTNRASTNRKIDALEVVLWDKEGNRVQSWHHRLGKNEVEKGASLRFMTSAIDASGKAVRASIVIDPDTVH